MTRTDQNERFAGWMREHASILHKVARSFRTRPAEEPDLLQEIQVAVWHSIPAFNGDAKVSSYIYRVALNRAITWVRRERSYRRKLDELAISEAILPATETPDPRLELVYAAIRRLNQAERALILMQLDGFSYDDIAQALGLSTSNVGVRLLRIRQKLAHDLKEDHAP